MNTYIRIHINEHMYTNMCIHENVISAATVAGVGAKHIHTYIYIYIYMYICIHHIYINMYICIYVCMYVSIHIHVFSRIHV